MRAIIKNSVIIPVAHFKAVRWCKSCVNKTLHTIKYDYHDICGKKMVVFFKENCIDCCNETGIRTKWDKLCQLPAKEWAYLVLGIEKEVANG